MPPQVRLILISECVMRSTTCKKMFFLILFLVCFCTSYGVVLYSNDFNAGQDSLKDFETFTYTYGAGGTSEITIDSGQLKIHSQGQAKGFAVLNINSMYPQYSPILANNPGTITWAFNVSNQNLNSYSNSGCGIAIASSAANWGYYTSTAYYLGIGGYVYDRMILAYHGIETNETPIIDIQDGLPTLPSKGSFRITYNPSNSLWCFYGYMGESYIDPTTVNNLLGSVYDSTFTHDNLPYICFSSSPGIAYIDNFSLAVIPEPATLLLFALGGLLIKNR